MKIKTKVRAGYTTRCGGTRCGGTDRCGGATDDRYYLDASY